MKLYHGTNHKYLDTILANGLTPRGGDTGNWEKLPSHNEMVYMSDAYSFYYSIISETDGNINKGVVFEIDTDRLDASKFHPDEDFIIQQFIRQGEEMSEAKTQEINENLEAYQEYWEKSLESYGCICHYGVIPTSAFTRYCIIDFIKRPELANEIKQPMLTIENYETLSFKYKEIIKWFFGDIDKLNSLIQTAEDFVKLFEMKNNQEQLKVWKNAVELWENESKKREGIEVVVL